MSQNISNQKRVEIQTEVGKLIAFPECGCFWNVIEGTLWYCPMYVDETPDLDNVSVVELIGKEQVSVLKNFFGEKIDLSNIHIEE